MMALPVSQLAETWPSWSSIWALGAVMLVIWVLYLIVKALEEHLKAVVKERQEKEEAAQRKKFDALAIRVIADLMGKHGTALCARHRLLVAKDVYGVVKFEAWETELAYFMEHVVVDAFTSQISKDAPSHEEAKNEWDWLISVWRTYGGQVQSALNEHVSALVLAQPDRMPDDSDFQPAEFERFCADELQIAGWDVVVMGGSGDQGVDVLATKAGKKMALQCKLYSQPVGNYAVQEVFTGKSFHQADLAAVVSNADFTPSALAAAKQTGVYLLHHSQLRTFEPGTGDERS